MVKSVSQRPLESQTPISTGKILPGLGLQQSWCSLLLGTLSPPRADSRKAALGQAGAGMHQPSRTRLASSVTLSTETLPPSLVQLRALFSL